MFRCACEHVLLMHIICILTRLSSSIHRNRISKHLQHSLYTFQRRNQWLSDVIRFYFVVVLPLHVNMSYAHFQLYTCKVVYILGQTVNRHIDRTYLQVIKRLTLDCVLLRVYYTLKCHPNSNNNNRQLQH